MDPKNAEPLYYAIIRLFADGYERTSENVLAELEPVYGSRKLFTLKGIDEALATARENGLLEETSYGISESGDLVVGYTIAEFGEEAVAKYL